MDERGQGLVGVITTIAIFAVAIGLTTYVVSEIFVAMPSGEPGSAAENAMRAVETRTYSGLNIASILIIVLVATAIFALFTRFGRPGPG